jgi:hypothetical protein
MTYYVSIGTDFLALYTMSAITALIRIAVLRIIVDLQEHFILNVLVFLWLLYVPGCSFSIVIAAKSKPK